MVSRIVDTGVKGTYVNGQTLSYHLNQGPHTIVLKIGKKNYNRDIVIPPDNQPVRIYASFNGRAQISIDQPNVPVAQAGAPAGGQAVQAQTGVTYAQPAPKDPGKPKGPLSIVAFILSLTFYLSWAGAGLGAVEVFVLDKKKEKNHIFSYLAMGIGTFLTIALIMGSCSPKSNNTEVTTATEITTTVTTEATTKETEATTTAASSAESSSEDTTAATESKDSNVVDPKLKEFMDSYEAYMDEYIAFMKKMNDDPTNATLLAEYTKMLVKYNEFAQAIEKYDTEKMSPADSAYYLEVMARVNKKLMDANVDIANQ